MEKYIDEKTWKKLFKNYFLVDAALLDKDTIFLCGRKNISIRDASRLTDFDIPTSFYKIDLTNLKEPCKCSNYIGVAFPTVGCSYHPYPVQEGVMLNRNFAGEILSLDSETNGAYENISDSLEKGHSVSGNRLCTINGTLYTISGNRRVFKRVAQSKWVWLNNGISLTDDEVLTSGFDDIDGFTESDMYAVGGMGDVWHYNGELWSRLAFPSNEELSSVCCAGDGFVYIGGSGCSLWRGKHNQWERLAKSSSSINFNDLKWYQGKLFVSSDYVFKFWDGKKLTEVLDKNGEEVPICGHMDVHDGVLVIASPSYVMLFDGTDWSHIVAPYFKK